MRTKKILLSVVSIGILVACSDVSTGGEVENSKVTTVQSSQRVILLNEQNSTKPDANITDESKRFKVELAKLEHKQKKLEILSSLEEGSLKKSHKGLLQELQELKWEKEILEEKLALQKLKDEKLNYESEQRQKKELEKWEHKANIAEAKAKELEVKILLTKTDLEAKQLKMESEIELLKTKKERDSYIVAKEFYLDNPLCDNNETLIISDRRIDLNGPITYDMAERISNQVNYLNNKNDKKPIFIVIDSSPGGSIMAGNIIIRSMESSDAPVYVVLKSFAASMAAVIVTLADKSYAYPQAVMLHHQPMALSFGYSNLTEEREKYEELQKWWEAFGEPIAKKMGISSDEFVKQMYQHSSRGDWQEFAKDAKALKWVNNIVMQIEDKSIRIDPLHKEKKEEESSDHKVGVLGEGMESFAYLPRLRPADLYFMYDPSQYYRVR